MSVRCFRVFPSYTHDFDIRCSLVGERGELRGRVRLRPASRSWYKGAAVLERRVDEGQCRLLGAGRSGCTLGYNNEYRVGQCATHTARLLADDEHGGKQTDGDRAAREGELPTFNEGVYVKIGSK